MTKIDNEMAITINSNCPKCKKEIGPSHKFCPSCGRRIGFGVRSENEIRAQITEIENTQFVVKDQLQMVMVKTDLGIMRYVLDWVLGEKDDTPIEFMIKNLTENQIRR